MKSENRIYTVTFLHCFIRHKIDFILGMIFLFQNKTKS